MKSKIKTLAVWLIIGMILIVLISAISENATKKMPYSELLSNIELGQVEEIVINSNGEMAEVKLRGDNIKKEVNRVQLVENKTKKPSEVEVVVNNNTNEMKFEFTPQTKNKKAR